MLLYSLVAAKILRSNVVSQKWGCNDALLKLAAPQVTSSGLPVCDVLTRLRVQFSLAQGIRYTRCITPLFVLQFEVAF
jgi:hypothetical protein